MPAASFCEWRSLPVSLGELCINTTLRCGQSFRWHQVPGSDEWRCVLRGRILSLRQDPSYLYYRTHFPSAASAAGLPTPPDGTPDPDDTLALIKHYFNLKLNLTELYSQWSSRDANFRKKAPEFAGIRILRQDAWEALICFICSSNNNIARISQMVEKLCLNYGALVGTIDGRAYHDFPDPDTLTGVEVEGHLRSLGFGYRAKFISKTASIIVHERQKGWLEQLGNPEFPAFGVEPRPAEEMQIEGREGYRIAHESLVELQGVGPKVADCVCLMGLGWGEAVPVDTHVWNIAQRDYKFNKRGHKSLTKATYDAVGNHFRKLWGKEAGWAHSVLFTADLRTFSERLAAVGTKSSKKTLTSPVAVKRPAVNEPIEPAETVTTTMRRTSKRLCKEHIGTVPQ